MKLESIKRKKPEVTNSGISHEEFNVQRQGADPWLAEDGEGRVVSVEGPEFLCHAEKTKQNKT